MNKIKILIGIDLEWPLAHHYDTIKGILKYAEVHDWECEIISWMEFATNFDVIPHCNGIIGRITPSLREYCLSKQIPVINIWNNSPVEDVPKVSIDLAKAGVHASKYFVDRGFSEILMLSEKNYHRACDLKTSMEDYLKDQIDSYSISFPKNDNDVLEFNEFAINLLRVHKMPMAIFSLSPFLARYLSSWCNSNGVYIPEEITILSMFYNSFVCDTLKPRISYVDHDFKIIGEKAAECLHRILKGEKIPLVTKVDAGKIVDQDSHLDQIYDSPQISEAIKFIRDNCQYQIQIEDIARFLGMSRRSIERKFKNCTGITLLDQIYLCRLKKAQRLLIEKKLSLGEIAIQSGFSGSYHMNKIFKKIIGKTPQEYRGSL